MAMTKDSTNMKGKPHVYRDMWPNGWYCNQYEHILRLMILAKCETCLSQNCPLCRLLWDRHVCNTHKKLTLDRFHTAVQELKAI